jgi:crotonobetainyl-CoA:carnitine CoA-transferase CaiB-like acyl-CoA transferase
MRLGDVVNAEAADNGRPLDGVRVLAAEQMQALPYGTQLLARLGADVVKIEHPTTGETGRGSFPHVPDPDGRPVGATFLRNNLGKRSVGLDLKHPAGRELFLDLVPRFDVVAENFKAGTMDRLGLGYDVLAARHPAVIWLSLSGFGNTDSPYRSWPAYAAIVEAMSGIYEYKREPGHAPRANPVGALGDISSALFGTIGVLAALRHRDRTGRGQRIDVAMLDAMVAMTDIVTNLWSLGIHGPVEDTIGAIVDTFAAADGHFVLQCVRPQHFRSLAEIVGRPDWNDDPRFATGTGWVAHRDEVRAAIETWAATRTRTEAAAALGAAGLAAGPCLTPPEVIADEHVAARHMLVEVPRPGGEGDEGGGPILVPGNPVKMSGVAEGPETRVPWLGEHTDEVLSAELGLSADELGRLRADGVIG